MLLVALLLCPAGCGRPSVGEALPSSPKQGSGESHLNTQQVQEYQRAVESFQDACIAQVYAFTGSMESNDIPAGREAAAALKEELDGFQTIRPPEQCADAHALFTQAWEKAGTIYTMMLQILGDRQYDNDDMPYIVACEDAAEMFTQCAREGFVRLDRLLNAS